MSISVWSVLAGGNTKLAADRETHENSLSYHPRMPSLDVPLSSRFDAALALAHRVHRRQARKGTQVPYISHVLGVASIVLEYGGTEDEAIAALLHDALEDAPDDLPAEDVRRLIAEGFGDAVLDIVEDCTDTTVQPKPPWRERKARYVARAEHASLAAMRVSAADKLHNPETGQSGTLGYYRALADIYKRRLPGPLADDLDLAVGDLEKLTHEPGQWTG